MNREVIKAATRGAARLFDFDSSINKRRNPVRSKAPEKRPPLDPVKETRKLMIKSNNIVLKMLYIKIHEQMEKQRMIIQLRDIESYEYNEIAKVMDMEPTAIRVALSRARKTLREKFIKQQNHGISQN